MTPALDTTLIGAVVYQVPQDRAVRAPTPWRCDIFTTQQNSNDFRPQLSGGIIRVQDNPFDTVESALEFLSLFDAAIAMTLTDVRRDLAAAEDATRRSEALRLAVYKLEKLEHHIGRSKRMANDLRILRRLLFEERKSASRTEAALAASLNG